MDWYSTGKIRWTTSDPNFEVSAVLTLKQIHSTGKQNMSRPAKIMIQPRKAEVNYLPPHAQGQTAAHLESSYVKWWKGITPWWELLTRPVSS